MNFEETVFLGGLSVVCIYHNFSFIEGVVGVEDGDMLLKPKYFALL